MKQVFEIRISNSKSSISKALEVRNQVFVLEQGILSEKTYDLLDNEAYHALAYLNNEVIGTARLIPEENQGGILARVAVVKNHRNHGVGTKLIKSLENKAKEIDIKTITIFPHEHLKSYYEVLGYCFVDVGSIVFGHQLIKMHKTLI